MKPKVREMEITKLRELCGIENQKQQKNTVKSFFKKKIRKPLARLSKKKKEKTQLQNQQ